MKVKDMCRIIVGIVFGAIGWSAAFAADLPTMGYPWRGHMLDVSRHFFTVEEVKKTLDAMAAFDLNVFHWHLTDSEGWRIQIDAYPRLTTVGAERTNKVYRTSTMSRDDVAGRYGPFFYTKAQIREVVAYAAARGIRVVPEIDVPGHSGAALRAYPSLRCRGAEKGNELCLGRDETFAMYERILDEVLELFPDEAIHLGGDECAHGNWSRCPDCQRRIRELGLRGEKGLQGWAMGRFARFLEKRGRRMVAWDDVVDFEDLPRSVIIMTYRAQKGLGPVAAARGHDVVVTDDDFCYLDYVQGLEDDPVEYQPFGCVLTWGKIAAFDPAANYPQTSRSHVLGGQGNLWTELVCDLKGAEWRTWPRLAAIADVLKNGPERNAEAFAARMRQAEGKLAKLGVQSAPLGPLFPERPAFEDGVRLLWQRRDFAKLLPCKLDETILCFDCGNRDDAYRKVFAKRDATYPSGAYTLDLDWMGIEVAAADKAGFDNALRQLRKMARNKPDGVREFPSCRISFGEIPEHPVVAAEATEIRCWTNAVGRVLKYRWHEPRHMQLGANYPMTILQLYDEARASAELTRMERQNEEAFFLSPLERDDGTDSLVREFVEELGWSLRPLDRGRVVSLQEADFTRSARTTWFEAARFGMFIHWGIYSIPGKGEWSYAYDSYKPGEYEAFARRFNPVNYRPREWARLAKAAGMKYAVLTSRHHDGFCMFDSHFTDYKITKSPYGKDAVREFLEAFRAEGLKVGLYHSLPDWTHPGYADTESPECLREGGAKEPHVPTPEQYASFTNLVWNHVNQLTTEYGKLDLLFFDYTSQTKAFLDYFGRDRLLETVYANQPDIIVNDRLSYYKDNCRDFDYYTPEICVPNQPQTVKGRAVPWETCATMNDHWGYCREDQNWKTPEAVVAGLIGCVSKNGNLLLNVGPTELGEIPDGSVRILRAMADWYAANGESVTGCGLSRFTPPHGCVYTQKGDTLYCHFLQSPLGDTILPQLKGRISRLTLLRTGEEIKQINHWGFELLKSDEQRIRTRGIRPGDVVRIDLNSFLP